MTRFRFRRLIFKCQRNKGGREFRNPHRTPALPVKINVASSPSVAHLKAELAFRISDRKSRSERDSCAGEHRYGQLDDSAQSSASSVGSSPQSGNGNGGARDPDTNNELSAKMASAMLMSPSSLVSPASSQGSGSVPLINSCERTPIGSPISNPPSSLESPRMNCGPLLVPGMMPISEIFVPST